MNLEQELNGAGINEAHCDGLTLTTTRENTSSACPSRRKYLAMHTGAGHKMDQIKWHGAASS